MKAADYVANFLIQQGVTDIFGVPGGVILDLLYAVEKRRPEIMPHLNYHEQMAGLAACGYAQAGRKLGVAYAARGPGIANMVACMAEAYYESLPVLFITAHENHSEKAMRCEYDQEADFVESVQGFTKYAASVDSVEMVPICLETACRKALDGRKGPVFLDFSSKLFRMETESRLSDADSDARYAFDAEAEAAAAIIAESLGRCRRPVLLIGDGVRQADSIEAVRKWIPRLHMPVLSSRAAQDIAAGSKLYYGYIGSHASRYSNFILSKADLILAVGNRLSFPLDSESFRPVVEMAEVLRFEIDKKELLREIPGAVNFYLDIGSLLKGDVLAGISFDDRGNWTNVCSNLKQRLNGADLSEPTVKIAQYLKYRQEETVYICDVGCHEFWFSRAFEYIRPAGQVLYSKSFGTLGSALGRAIGAYYATGKDVVCVIGDQGFQYNIQELQYLSSWKLPITVLLINNKCSGMIRDQEEKKYGRYVHVTQETGYGVPDFQKIAEGYGIKYVQADALTESEMVRIVDCSGPLVCEMACSSGIRLEPYLPKGNPCQKMAPLLDEKLYAYLDRL